MCAMARPGRSLGLALGALLLAGTALTACGGSSSGGSGGTPSSSATGSGSAAEGVGVPAGYPIQAATIPGLRTSLTTPGTTLRLGQSATVAWKPTQHLVGGLEVTVTAVRQTTFKKSFKGWQLDAATRANTPYFVTATVRNAGQSDLSGQQVPLYGSAASGALVEASSFASDFKPCHPGVLPTPFRAGDTAHVCLVYLVPGASDGAKGSLDGVSFRPSETFDPITWSGETTAPSPTGSPTAGPTGAPGGGTPASSPPASLGVHMSGSPVR